MSETYLTKKYKMSYSNAFFLFTLSLLFLWQEANGQEIRFVETKYLNDSREWEFLDEYENNIGEFKSRFWGSTEQFSEFNIILNDEYINATMVWPDRADEWSFSNDITARTLWNDNFHEWRISNGELSFQLIGDSKYYYEYWYIEVENRVVWEMFTEQPGNMNAWVINNFMKDELPEEFNAVLPFMVCFYSQ